MTDTAPARRRWHPVPAGGGLLVVALGLAALGLAAPAGAAGPPGGWLPPVAWLVLGVTAGFATSGST